MRVTFPRWFMYASACLGIALSACAPEIGDSCTNSNDCSANTDRLCDTTQLDGYCTIFNCDPTSCPSDESVCVQFGGVLSSVGSCPDPSRPAPQSRTFCMRKCENNSDCRAGYRCINVAGDNAWAAALVERNPSSTKVCIEPQAATPIADEANGDPDRADAVCGGVNQSAGGAGGLGAGGAGLSGAAGLGG